MKQSLQFAALLALLTLLLSCCKDTLGCGMPEGLHKTMLTRIDHHKHLTTAARSSEQQAAQQQAPKAAQDAIDRRRLQTTAAPIRIQPEFQLSSTLSASTQATIRAVVTAAIQSLQGYLQVRTPVGSSGLLATPQLVTTTLCNRINANPTAYGGQTCSGAGWYPTFDSSLPKTDIKYPSCGPATVNPAHVLTTSCITQSGTISCQRSASGATGGAQTDYYMYITSDAASCPANVAAFALPCFYELTTNRPVIGALNLCSIAINSYTSDKLLATVTHELLHALGFTNDLFSLYINPSTRQELGTSSVVFTSPATGASTLRNNYTMVITPTVLREVRDQFGCSTLGGAALEDQGGSGSAGSHWEYELFQGDLMTPTKPADSGNQRISRLTLALLEDSGWYLGNWTAGAALDWGRGAGCNLPEQTCSAYQTSTSGQPYFCSNPGTQTDQCSFNGISHGYCVMNPTFSRCGIVNTLSAPNSGTPTVVQPSCMSSAYTNAGATNEAAGRTAFGWSIGATSRCLLTSLPLQSTTPSPNGLLLTSTAGSTGLGVCWTASCTASGTLTYNLAGQSVACPTGSSISLSTLASNIRQGTVTCPRSTLQATTICRTLQCPTTGCSNPGGNCFEGKCVCRLGNTGTDCSTDLFAAALGAPPSPSPSPSTAPINQGTGGTLNPGSALTPGTSTSSAAETGSSGLSGTTLTIVIIVASVVGAIIVIAVIGIIIVAARGSTASRVNPNSNPQNPPSSANLAAYPAPAPGQAPGAYPGGAPPPMYPSYAPAAFPGPPGYNAAPPTANAYYAPQPQPYGTQY